MATAATLRKATLAVAFAFAVYGATTVLDRQVDHLGSTIQPTAALLQAPPPSASGGGGLEITDGVFESSTGDIAPTSLWLLWLPESPLVAFAMLIWVGLMLGGLPIAALAIVLDRMSPRWSGAIEPLYYLCFVCQMLSLVFTAALVVMLFPMRVTSFFAAFITGYLYAQVVVDVMGVLAWRRLLERASCARLNTYFLRTVP